MCGHGAVYCDTAEVWVKYYHFDSLYESGSFGRVAPEENFGGFILSFGQFYDCTARATPGGCGGVSPPRRKNSVLKALERHFQ